MSSNNMENLSTGKEFKIDGITYNLPGMKFHGRRDDGVIVRIFRDDDLAETALKQYRQERDVLVTSGKVIL